MSKNTIVVTGGAGFVGTNLIKLFLKKTKYKIISIDDYSSGKKNNHLKNSRVKYISGKTKNISSIIKNVKEIVNIYKIPNIFIAYIDGDENGDKTNFTKTIYNFVHKTLL